MNILVLNWRDVKHSWAGGSEIYILELAKRWVSRGHSVTLFCGQDQEKILKPFEKISGVNVYRKGSRFTVYFWAAYYYFVKFRKQTDTIVDTENGIPFFTPLYSLKPKACIVFHVHKNQWFYEFKFPYNIIGYLIERVLFPVVYSRTRIVAISKTTMEDLVKIGFKPKRISIIYSGVEKKVARFPLLKKFSKPTIIYLGRIKKYKRINLLIKIMPQILKHTPKARLVIAGWGTEAPFIIDSVMKGNTHRHIDILGPVSEAEKRKLLSKSWLFVNPSIGEGWSIAVIEANLHGTPAVSFRVSGLSESIQNEKTGFLVQNEKELVEKINLILSDNKKREDMSILAKKWAESFSWDL